MDLSPLWMRLENIALFMGTYNNGSSENYNEHLTGSDISDMSEEYTYNDEVSDGENSGLNIPDESGEKNRDKSDKVNSSRIRQHSPWAIFLRLFYSPLSAWKQLKNSSYGPERTAAKVFYPLIALASAGAFIGKYYDPGLSVAVLLQNAIGIFIAFFIGYYLVIVLCRAALPGDGKAKIDIPYGRKWLQFLMSTLAVFFTIFELVPALEPVLVFTPIYTVYLSLRGVRFLRLKEVKDAPVGWAVGILAIGVPYGIFYIFEAILPAA